MRESVDNKKCKDYYSVDNFSDFRNHFQRGLQCSYSSASDCGRAVTRSWIFIAAFTCGTFSQYLLVQSSDGAIFASIVEAVVGPLASLFWTLYRYNKSDNSIHWHPVFNETTAFSLAGLEVILQKDADTLWKIKEPSYGFKR
uniref:Uncharacterized protein n=1 Tax=Magallana gigas TaxID=29159 RepID=K1PN94_MAGGI